MSTFQIGYSKVFDVIICKFVFKLESYSEVSIFESPQAFIETFIDQ